jgi:His-Xaa-Ser system radical SAM maturase HxsC
VIVRSVRGVPHGIAEPLLLRVTDRLAEGERRPDDVLVVDRCPEPQGAGAFGAVLALDAELLGDSVGVSGVVTDHLDPGDVVRINPNGVVQTLYRRNSSHNALFATDQCNSYCLMCSQPPKKIDDRERMSEHLRLIQLIDPTTTALSITGGEPTLFKDDFLQLVSACKTHLPATALHILTNGRLFYYDGFARQLGAIDHPDLMLGIPLYSDLDYDHDHVVQARGAFEQTIIGLQNLGRYSVPVEIRVVVHALTWERLPELAEFIYRNVTFADHVTFMGLEMMGFSVPNVSDLWIDPWDYREKLEEAVLSLADRGMTVSIYNHQLCTLPPSVWAFARRSISDWKNEYLPGCEPCAVRATCGGFFSSCVQRKRYSTHIQAVQ